jgi:DNA-binding MarR family transcriptional regulator
MPVLDRLPFGYQLRRAQYAYRLALDRTLEPTGVTTPQFAVLALLQATPGLSNADLARQSLITPQTMHVILGRLQAAGLLTRRAHPGHGRILLADLTPAGHDVLNQCLERAVAVEARLLGALDTEQQPMLLNALTRVGDVLGMLSPLPRPAQSLPDAPAEGIAATADVSS